MSTFRPRRWVAPASLLLLAFWALLGCDVVIAPTERDKQSEMLTVSLEAGATLRRGDLIDVSVQLPASTRAASSSGSAGQPSEAPGASYSVEVQLETSAGTLVTSRTFPYREGEALPPLTLDDLGLESQSYRLVIRLLQGQDAVARKVVDFYYVGEEYEIKEITSDAPSVHPGSTVVLTAMLRTPRGANPFIEWRWSGGVFASGKLRDGLDSAQWTSPRTEGIYAITATLYPLGPGTASVFLSSDIYVSVVKDPVGELGPAASYHGLYHLMGDLTDSSPARQPGSFLGDTPLLLLTRGKVVGYRLDGSGGISVPLFLLPTRDGALEPFTVSFGFTPPQPPFEGSLLRLATTDESVELTVSFTSADSIVAELRQPQGTSTLSTSASAFKPGVRSAFSLSISPTSAAPVAGAQSSGGSLTAVWFIDGVPQATADWATRPRVTDARGTTVVGGPGSVQGMFDELGVYVRDAQGRATTDGGIYRRGMVEQHGAATVADGFDGMYLPGDLSAEGEVAIDRGVLDLRPGSKLLVPAYRVGPSGLRITLTLAAAPDPASRIGLSWIGGDRAAADILLVTGAGALTAAGVVEDYRFAPSRVLDITLRPELEQVMVEIQGLSRDGKTVPSFTVPLPSGDNPAVVLELANGTAAGGPLRVDSFAIWPLP